MILSKMSLKLSPAVYALSQLLLFMCSMMISGMVATHHQEERLEHSSNTIRCIDRERQALLHFKQGLSDACGILTSWGSVHGEDQYLHRDCCQWRGIGCSNSTGHVISLNLQGPLCSDSFCCNGLRGNVSSSLLVLEHLNYLDLSGINFLNSLIPNFIGSLVRLTYLSLSGSNLNGEIPSQFKNLSNLQTLDLSYNEILHPKSLAWASGLSSLKTLNLNGVNLTDATDWVHIINSLPSLTQLNLEGCNLHNISPLSHLNSSKSLSYIYLGDNFLSTASVYLWLFNISSNLVKLVLSNNLLKGPIPEAIVNLNSLSYLDLSHNQLQGPIPEAIVNLSSLSYLALSDNQLQGPILEGIGSMKILSYLDLSFNQFKGGIPKSFRHLCSLRTLDLDSNNLTGDLFSLSGCVERSLETLSLGKNSLSSSLPDFSKFPSLRYLNLSYNELNGSFPSLANSNSSLEYLILGNNQIIGSFPDELAQLSQLEMLDLSSNFLNGTITKAHLSNLTWKGSSHEYWKNLAFLKSIDLSSNQFSGEIPVEISSLVELQSLNLSRNYLSGPITWKLGQLKRLESLDLSRNLLSGEISISLLTLNFLNTLDLSYNNLSGKIPSGTQLQSFNESSYMGNPKLCGSPLQKCKEDAAQGDNHSGEEAKDQDRESLSLGLYISIELGFITGFWGACGILVFKKSWRYAYFQLCNQLYDRIFVAVVVYVVRPIARFQA